MKEGYVLHINARSNRAIFDMNTFRYMCVYELYLT